MNLDDLTQIKKLDTEKVSQSIELMPDQIRQVIKETNSISLPASFTIKTPSLNKKISQIVVNGMGGSNLGAKIIKSALADKLKLPLNIEPGYALPGYIGKNTLYIISSYSGNTEEPLSTYEEAKKRNAKIVGLTSAGDNRLGRLMKKEKIPGYIFSPEYNPSKQPRLGIGYTFTGIALILFKAGALKINLKELNDIISYLEIETKKLKPEMNAKNNSAKKIALELYGKRPTLVAGEFLAGNIEVLRNQMSENSKQLPNYLTLPDLNHFAMEGLAFPAEGKKNAIFLFFNSELYSPQLRIRNQLTKKVVKKNNIKTIEYSLKSDTKLKQALEFMQLGSWITYYLGLLNGVNPVEIPWVDWFKKELK